MVIKMILGISLLVLAQGCTHSSIQKIDGLDEGMTRSLVVEKLGSPTYNIRKNGQDHWIYQESTPDGKLQRQTLVFQDSILVKVGPLRKDWGRLLRAENAKSMEEYESLVKPQDDSEEGFVTF